jgi:hypothetical protein
MMSISFYPYIYNNTLNYFDFPEACEDTIDLFVINVCEANARDILNTLGFAVEGKPVAIGVFAQLISNTLRKHLNHKSPLCEQVELIEPGKMTIIHMGRREGYIEEKIFELAKLAHRAKDAGATHIGWV